MKVKLSHILFILLGLVILVSLGSHTVEGMRGIKRHEIAEGEEDNAQMQLLVQDPRLVLPAHLVLDARNPLSLVKRFLTMILEINQNSPFQC